MIDPHNPAPWDPDPKIGVLVGRGGYILDYRGGPPAVPEHGWRRCGWYPAKPRRERPR